MAGRLVFGTHPGANGSGPRTGIFVSRPGQEVLAMDPRDPQLAFSTELGRMVCVVQSGICSMDQWVAMPAAQAGYRPYVMVEGTTGYGNVNYAQISGGSDLGGKPTSEHYTRFKVRYSGNNFIVNLNYRSFPENVVGNNPALRYVVFNVGVDG